MAPRNGYYESTINEFFMGKDSIFEMVKIINYDRERMMARVYTLQSSQYRDDVPVLFPSIFENTGIISPPLNNSTAMMFWGPDRQTYLLPVQYNYPNLTIKKGVRNLSSSPGFKDETLSLKNIQQGEHLIRSLGRSYVIVKNSGDVEMGTPSLYRLALTEKDGALDSSVERIKQEIGNNQFYFGPASRDSSVDTRTHWFFSMSEISDRAKQLPTTKNDQSIVQDILNNRASEIEIVPPPKIYTKQMGHVLDENGSAEVDANDESQLFLKKTLVKDGTSRTETLSKKGRKVIMTKGNGIETEIITSSQEVKVIQRREESSIQRITSIGINETGEIVVEKDGKNFDLWPVLEWFYEQRTV